MKFKIYLSFMIMLAGITSYAQLITLKGTVTNAKTGEPVPGASILSGSFGTSADNEGKFVFYIQQPVIEESGITVSSIGYETNHITDITDNYNAILTPATQELKTVKVFLGAEDIVQKAFRLVPVNYINKGFNITGIQRMVHSIRDTFGYQYYYVSKSKLRMYLSAYGVSPVVAQTGLVEKEEKLTRNPNASLSHFVNGYLIPLSHDYVHTGATIIKGSSPKFKYLFNGKELVDGRKTYVINFFSLAKDGNAGILYIDTASYAFVKILYTKYNVQTPHYIDLDKITISIQYKKYDGGWALNVIKFNSKTENRGFDLERADEFYVGRITSDQVVQLPQDAIIKEHVIDDHTNPQIDFNADEKNIPNSVLKIIEKSLPKIKFPEITNDVHQPKKQEPDKSTPY